MACKETTEESFFVDDRDYYPLDNTRIYEVMDIRYEITGVDTLNYFLRESISDTLVSGNDTTFILLKERGSGFEGNWETDSLWNLRQTLTELVVRENGTDKVKLVFPVREDIQWDRNKYNTLSAANTNYRAVGLEELRIDESLVPDRVIQTVISDIPPNITGQNQHYELYGKGVGLLQKNLVLLKLCTGEDGCEIGDTLSGRFIEMKLIDYE